MEYKWIHLRKEILLLHTFSLMKRQLAKHLAIAAHLSTAKTKTIFLSPSFFYNFFLYTGTS